MHYVLIMLVLKNKFFFLVINMIKLNYLENLYSS